MLIRPSLLDPPIELGGPCSIAPLLVLLAARGMRPTLVMLVLGGAKSFVVTFDNAGTFPEVVPDTDL